MMTMSDYGGGENDVVMKMVMVMMVVVVEGRATMAMEMKQNTTILGLR